MRTNKQIGVFEDGAHHMAMAAMPQFGLGDEFEKSENENTQNFYDSDFLESSVDNDMISDSEGGFMAGYLADQELAEQDDL